MFSMVLSHSGCKGKDGRPLTTSLTTIDVHDIARSCRTYDVMNFYVVHPHPEMHEILRAIVSHWDEGAGAALNPDRKEALSVVKPVYTFAEVVEDVEKRTGKKPYLVGTTAKLKENAASVESLKKNVYKTLPLCIILGSGYGLSDEFLAGMDAVMRPLRPGAQYNHLSVRAAAAITLDRFFGDD